MTEPKREPWARSVALRYSDGGGQTYGVEVFGFKLAGNFNESGALLRAMEINARVDEEIEKAVVDFREKCLDIVLGDCYGLVTDEREAAHNADIVAIAEKIRDLPTEPERGKE